MTMQPVTLKVHTFRTDYATIAREIRSDVSVYPAINPGGSMKGRKYVGLWDTGATGSCITKQVVDDLGLISIGKAKCSHAQGNCIRDRYLVHMKLPNNVHVGELSVVEADLDGGVDVIIGMDIITLGDFVITNADDKTHFSFRIPALGGIDVSMPPTRSAIGLQKYRTVKPAKNAPCPCGSGRNYKGCCSPKWG